MKHLLSITLILASLYISAQSTDFILLKKHNRTVGSYFTGSSIHFTSVSGASIDAIIKGIKHDTIFLKEYVVRQLPTQLGVYILDTSYYYSQYHYNQIKMIKKTGRHFDRSGSGAALLGGGVVLTTASGVVYLADNKKFSPELLVASVGLMGLGYLLLRQSFNGMQIGKKYSLVYVSTSENKKE